MKNLHWIILLSLFMIAIPSCSRQDSQLEQQDSQLEQQDSQLEQIETPVWSLSDLEITQMQSEKIYIYEVENYKKPPFYEGSMPMKFQIGYPPAGLPGFAGRNERPLFYDFGNFLTYFIYYQGVIVGGAQTYDKEGHLLAEVSSVNFYVTEENEQGIEIEELHYGEDGKLIFRCKSQIDPYEGSKIRETEQIGKKIKDYYFIWPTY